MILVISWWGFRAFYALGVLKAIEELKINDKIKACFGVSWWAIVLAWWLSWYKADEIFEILMSLNYLKFLKPTWKLHKSLIDFESIEKLFTKYLKSKFEDLEKQLFIGTVDLLKGEYILFNKWNLIKPLLGSMSLPGIFPGVKYNWRFLVDWGVINNFPTDLAKEKFPKEKIIWIALNNVGEVKSINNIFDNLIRSWQLSIEASTLENLRYCDILFYPKLDVKILDIRKKKMKEIFNLWFNTGVEKLKILHKVVF